MRQWGVRREHLIAMHRALYDALLKELGPDAFNAEAQSSWLQVSTLVLRTLEGYV